MDSKEVQDALVELEDLRIDAAHYMFEAEHWKRQYDKLVSKTEVLKYQLFEHEKLVKDLRKQRDEWKGYYDECFKENDMYVDMHNATIEEYNSLFLEYQRLKKEFSMTNFGIGEIDDFEVKLPDNQQEDYRLDIDEYDWPEEFKEDVDYEVNE